jgi:hypothetical protein
MKILESFSGQGFQFVSFQRQVPESGHFNYGFGFNGLDPVIVQDKSFELGKTKCVVGNRYDLVKT